MQNQTRSKLHSLEEVHRTVRIPSAGSWVRRLVAFAGPAYMVSVGYMDPGNWATDIEGGARFGYQLLWVLLMSNMMAVLLQTLSARLGLVTGRDLAQACREGYPRPIGYVLWFLCEIAIAACDLAEVLGTAIGLNLLFGLPLLWGVIITGFDVILLLAIQRYGIRKMEGFILMLISTIGMCFIIEIFLSQPEIGGIISGFVPRLNGESLYVAIGILGATVMPHNLYLHSALVQSRAVKRTPEGIAQACKYNLVDSAVALNAAFFVNAAILIVASATFFRNGIIVTEIQQAHALLNNILGTTIAPIAFAIALLCAGQSSTLTGTLAGQIVMEGFLDIKLRPWVRRLITRAIAIVPAVIVIAVMGDQGTYKLLILSQVILSLQLPFAIVPLIKFTGDRVKMGPFTNSPWVKILAWVTATIIIGLNARLIIAQLAEWFEIAGTNAWILQVTVVPIVLGLGLLLAWMTFRGILEWKKARPAMATAEAVVSAAMRTSPQYNRIALALDATQDDAAMLSEAVALAQVHNSELVLIHVVEGVGGQWYGDQTADIESRHDEAYLQNLARRLENWNGHAFKVKTRLGYGNAPKAIIEIAQAEKVDLLIVGGHGHRFVSDLLRGQTIDRVRHALGIPILAVRGRETPSLPIAKGVEEWES
ncbi:MAG: Nramp family divalent metal transporter [candidate division KSB1 bacterium]|nr:Nramp family divalent metal transporter [candidate division KSB1 bacterium]MDZ7302756.1 Nramp family divalent metal transporter [candidate division KSB1 bacterium]MDZ7310076.1 Nramp family divalent metal transporter [candidate division KSB1 bacterium]